MKLAELRLTASVDPQEHRQVATEDSLSTKLTVCPGDGIPSATLTSPGCALSVVKLGAYKYSGIAFLLHGNSPVERNPFWQTSTVVASFQTGVKTAKNSFLSSRHPPLSGTKRLPASAHLDFIDAKSVLSAGCSACVACGGKQSTSTLLSLIKFRN